MPKISIVVPCYFNEDNIKLLELKLLENETLFDNDVEFEYILVDDGSKDKTLEKLLLFKERYSDKVKVIKLSGNFGSLNAILAGLQYSSGDCMVILAADLQEPPEIIKPMYQYWQKGIKLVLANREHRNDGMFWPFFSKTYHFIIRKFAIEGAPVGGFDLVLFDRCIRDEVLKMNEKNTNLFYLLLILKYDYVTIPITRMKRKIGKSKWTLQKKIKLFIDSFVSFSFFPIRIISIMGLLLGFISLIYGLVVIYAKIKGLVPLQGWSALMVVILFVSSFQMIALGIIGEYLWRTLDAVRGRPNYIVEKVF